MSFPLSPTQPLSLFFLRLHFFHFLGENLGYAVFPLFRSFPFSAEDFSLPTSLPANRGQNIPSSSILHKFVFFRDPIVLPPPHCFDSPRAIPPHALGFLSALPFPTGKFPRDPFAQPQASLFPWPTIPDVKLASSPSISLYAVPAWFFLRMAAFCSCSIVFPASFRMCFFTKEFPFRYPPLGVGGFPSPL